MELQPPQFSIQPGPSGPAGIETNHSDFARRKCCKIQQVRVPRNGGPGVRRIWTQSVHPEPSPGDPLVSFPSLGKKLAPQGETLLQQTKGLYHCPLIRPPSGAPSPQGEGLKRADGEIPLTDPNQPQPLVPQRFHPPCKPTVSKTKTAGWWRADRPSARLTGRR